MTVEMMLQLNLSVSQLELMVDIKNESKHTSRYAMIKVYSSLAIV